VVYGRIVTYKIFNLAVDLWLPSLYYIDMNRNQIVEILKDKLELNIFNHSLALEACMGGVFDYLKNEGLLDSNEPSKEDWQMAGLLHDVDYSGRYKENHPNKTEEALKEYSIEANETVIHIIKAHAPEITGVNPKTKAEWAIFCADSLTGLITAVALIIPSKKLSDVKLLSVIKRFHKSPNFAAGTRRDEVAMCENKDGLNIPVDKFIEICFESMRNISSEIGL